MKNIMAIALLLTALGSCTKDKCYIVLDANHHELCSKCFHTIDERTVWMTANNTKTSEQQCQ